jgi:hypothetical protein
MLAPGNPRGERKRQRTNRFPVLWRHVVGEKVSLPLESGEDICGSLSEDHVRVPLAVIDVKKAFAERREHILKTIRDVQPGCER